MIKKLPLSSAILAALLIVPYSAAIMTYTLDGGNSTMDGSVGSLSFTNAAWSLTATADPSQVETGYAYGSETNFLPTTVTLSISDSVNCVTSMSLNDFTLNQNYKWGVFILDSNTVSLAGFGAWYTELEYLFLSDAIFGVSGASGQYSGLGTAGSWNGGVTSYGGLVSDGLTNLETNIGTLNLTVKDGVSPTGKFEIVGASVPDTSVPDTGSTAALLGAGVVALAFARRKLG